MGAKTKQVGGGTATPTANNWNQFLNSQLQGGMNQAMNNAQQPGMQQQGFQQALGGALSGQGGQDISGAGGLLQKYFQGGGGGGMADLTKFGTPQTATAGTAQTAQVAGTGTADLSKFGTAAQTGGTGMVDLSGFTGAQQAAGTGGADMSQFGTAAQAGGMGGFDLSGFGGAATSGFNTQAPISSDFNSMLMNMIQSGGQQQGQSGFSAASAGPAVNLASGMDYGQAYQTLGQDPLMDRDKQRAIAEQRARFGAEGAGALGTGAQYAESNLNAELAARDASMRRQQAMQLMGQDLQERMGAANVGLQGRGQNVQTSIANMQGGLQGAQNVNQFNTANLGNLLQAAGQGRGQDLSTGIQQLGLGAQQGQFNAGQQNAMQQAMMQAGLQNQNMMNQQGQFNAGQQNAMQQAMMNAQLQNQGMMNQQGQFNAGQGNAFQQAMMNAQLQNQQMGNQQGQFNTGQLNAMQQAMLNAQLQNQQLGNQFGQFNVGQQNQMNQFNTGQQNQMGQFNAGQANAMQQAMLNATLQNQQMGNQFGLGMLGQGMNMNQLAAQQQQNALNQLFGAFGQANELGTPRAQMVTQPSLLGQIGNAAMGLGSAYLGGGGTLGGIARGIGGLFNRGPNLPAPSPEMFLPRNTMNIGGFTPGIRAPQMSPLAQFTAMPTFPMPTFNMGG